MHPYKFLVLETDGKRFYEFFFTLLVDVIPDGSPSSTRRKLAPPMAGLSEDFFWNYGKNFFRIIKPKGKLKKIEEKRRNTPP